MKTSNKYLDDFYEEKLITYGVFHKAIIEIMEIPDESGIWCFVIVSLSNSGILLDRHIDFFPEKLKTVAEIRSGRIREQDQSYPKASTNASVRAELHLSFFSSTFLLQTRSPS